MATVPLPDRASFEQLRRQAKDLRRAVRAGAPGALAEVADRYPGSLTTQAAFPLSAAQLVVARRYGFASWGRLKQHCAVIERYTRFLMASALTSRPSLNWLDVIELRGRKSVARAGPGLLYSP